MLAWMMEYDSDIPEGQPIDQWNDAMQRSNELDSKVLEQSNRITAVHPADQRCHFCPPEIKPKKPKVPEVTPPTPPKEPLEP
jgi:hypothetical protein